MSESHGEGSAPTRGLEETRDELTQASIALNTAYDRLQELRSSLRSFTAQRDRLSGRTPQDTRPPNIGLMGPDHSAIVFSDSDEESEIEFLRESLPSRLLQLTSTWGHQHARLNVPRQVASAESHNDPSTGLSTTSSSEEPPRPIYPPPRRRRPQPPAPSTSRDGGTHPSGSASPARRSILEAHLRQLRHASNPAEPTTTLGRRVAQRAAAAQAAAAERLGTGTDAVAALETIIHSTLPLGLDSRPSPVSFGFGSTSPQGIESRAAAHLRHSLLPNPSSGVRLSPGSRTGSTAGAYPRFSDRLEHRPRTARSNSLTALTRPALGSLSLHGNPVETSTQVPLSSRLGQLRATTPTPLSGEEITTFNFGADPASASYRVRRRVNARGEEQVFNINWSELMSEQERDEDHSDPAAWMRPPRQPTRMRPDRPRAHPEPETDDTVVHDSVRSSSREARLIGRDGGAQRRRGWARLDADGDEISTEDEASFERARAESRLPRTRTWTRSGAAWAAGRGSTVAVLDFVHHNSRDATTGHRDPNTPLGMDTDDTVPTRQGNRSPTRILDSLFRSVDAVAYVSPLPLSVRDKRAHSPVPRDTKEVQVTMTGRVAGR